MKLERVFDLLVGDDWLDLDAAHLVDGVFGRRTADHYRAPVVA
jgi:hypothetical protein